METEQTSPLYRQDPIMMIFFFEAKITGNNHRGNLRKLVRELKDSIKSMNVDGYSNVSTLGLLVKGSLCVPYLMEHSFDGIYRLFLIDQFHVPISRYEMSRDPCFQVNKSSFSGMMQAFHNLKAW
ncbi:hypothetical protein MAM1_0285c09241 [Mucor ambiguus]|uniref:Uncharacterized protein n=1 Tax=Mucor ambiguus TaxID=91626 RepID=A0A0C9MQI3_9FUNG|nr:hypothetical protein MAM1_0285c09241 [Mucor ambiguus]